MRSARIETKPNLRGYLTVFVSQLVLTTPLVLLLPRAASACPVCFGASDGPMLRGSNAGILTLLVVTLVVLAAFGAFFRTLAKRANQFAIGGASVADLTTSQPHGGRAVQ